MRWWQSSWRCCASGAGSDNGCLYRQPDQSVFRTLVARDVAHSGRTAQERENGRLSEGNLTHPGGSWELAATADEDGLLELLEAASPVAARAPGAATPPPRCRKD